MKLPGIYAAYAVILAVFGQTHTAIHLGLLIINIATVFLLFLLGKRLFDNTVGLVGAAAFALLSLSQPVQGIFANAEHFVILPAIGGILLLLCAIDSNKKTLVFVSGLLLGLAFLMKQHAIAFILFAGVYLFISEIRRKPLSPSSVITKCLFFAVGVLIPFAVTCLILYKAGVFDKFWFWTFDYASQYVSSVSLSAGLKRLGQVMSMIIKSTFLIWFLAGAGVVGLLCKTGCRRKWLFALGFLFFSFLAICPGFYFRPHYFILLMPAVALMAGIGIGSITALVAKTKLLPLTIMIPLILMTIAIGHSVSVQSDYLFSEPEKVLFSKPKEVSRIVYGLNPFPESLEIAKYIKNNSARDDTIAILGSEPQTFFYADRHSATGYIYTYALMESHDYASQMQAEMIDEIEKAQPEFMVLANISTSWLLKPDSDKRIFKWFKKYIPEYYDVVGVVDIVFSDITIYRWGKEAAGYRPQSSFNMFVFRRKNGI